LHLSCGANPFLFENFNFYLGLAHLVSVASLPRPKLRCAGLSAAIRLVACWRKRCFFSFRWSLQNQLALTRQLQLISAAIPKAKKSFAEKSAVLKIVHVLKRYVLQ
jgi:hypothetical protein